MNRHQFDAMLILQYLAGLCRRIRHDAFAILMRAVDHLKGIFRRRAIGSVSSVAEWLKGEQ